MLNALLTTPKQMALLLSPMEAQLTRDGFVRKQSGQLEH